jgi:hypothetical protein
VVSAAAVAAVAAATAVAMQEICVQGMIRTATVAVTAIVPGIRAMRTKMENLRVRLDKPAIHALILTAIRASQDLSTCVLTCACILQNVLTSAIRVLWPFHVCMIATVMPNCILVSSPSNVSSVITRSFVQMLCAVI